MKFPIRRKLLTGFILFLVLAFLIESISFAITEQYISSQINSVQEVEVDNGASAIEDFFTQLNADSFGLARVYEQNQEEIIPVANYTIKNNGYINGFIDEITILSSLGHELIKVNSSGPVPQSKLTYEVYSDPFKSAVAGIPAISQVYYLGTNSEPYIDTFYPIFDEKHAVIGVVKMQVNLNQLRNEIAKIKLGQNGYVYVVDNNGLLISHPSQAYVLQKPVLTSRKIVNDALANIQPSSQDHMYRNEKNVKVIADAVKIPQYNWVAVFEQPVTEAFSFYNLIRNLFITTLGVSVLFLLLIALFLSENLTRSLRRLQKSAEQVENGQIERIVNIKSGDEIESLSHSFSSLIDQLIQREHLLEQISSQLKSTNERLKELDKLKNEFVSVASHELRTPMAAIKSYLWMALNDKGGPLNEKQRYYVERGYNSVDRLIRLVNDMLNISRIESGRITIELQSVDLLALTQEVLDEVLPRAKELGISVTIQKPEVLPRVLADPDKIKEVLFNLIGNSLKFTPKGGSITISYSRKENGFVETKVTDTGAGIVPEDMGKLFQKFGLLEGSYVTNQTSTSLGTGLGLYICRSIIDLHHGEIKAASEGRGKGSTFSFTLREFKDSDAQTLKTETTDDHKDKVDLIHAQV